MVVMDWHNFWASNKNFIDPVAPRHTAVETKDAVKAFITNGPAVPYTEDKPKHPKNASVGNKKVAFSNHIVLDQEDVKLMKVDEEITLMKWGNAYVRKITGSDPITEIELELHLEGDFKKTALKVTWLSTEGADLVPAECWEFDYLITKDTLEETDNWEDFLTPESSHKTDVLCDSNVADLKEDDIIQIERKGYYRVDKPASGKQAAVLFGIPTGKVKAGL